MSFSLNPLRVKGSFLGVAIGDALGWPEERPRFRKILKRNSPKDFALWLKREGAYKSIHWETVNPGEYSDDTQLTLAVARSKLTGEKWFEHFTQWELPCWLIYQRGGGRSLLRAAKIWNTGIPPWKINNKKELINYFQAGGNGVAMRILPHVIYDGDNPYKMRKHIFRNGITTHGHPRALIGALLHAESLRYLLYRDQKKILKRGEILDFLLDNFHEWSELLLSDSESEWVKIFYELFNEDYSQLWKKVCKETEKLLKIAKSSNLSALADEGEILSELGATGKFKGAGNITAVAAIFIFSKFASEPTNALIFAANFRGTDTDTLASMVGALVGALYAEEWIISEWQRVQDRMYIEKIAKKLLNKQVTNYLDKCSEISFNMLTRKKKINFGFFGQSTVQEIEYIKGKKTNFTRYRLRTQEGQTLYIKSINIKETEAHEELLKYEHLQKEILSISEKVFWAGKQEGAKEILEIVLRSFNLYSKKKFQEAIKAWEQNKLEQYLNKLINSNLKH